jgi:shikimate dehydrogenase
MVKPVKFVGIIGDPIHHSLSPVMHNAVFHKLKMQYLYLPFHVTTRQLPSFTKRCQLWGLKGFNITIPHKKAIMKYCDTLSSEAKAIGAVNTVVIQGKQWKGYNTDAEGYRLSLHKARCRPQSKSVVVLGAGGAARAVLYGLAQEKVETIMIVNRHLRKAQTLARDFRRLFPKINFTATAFAQTDWSVLLKDCYLLTNATAVGLGGTSFKNIPLRHMPKKSFVCDLVYTPLQTPLLKQAKRRGQKIIPGTDMLIYQGARAFTLWTRRQPSIPLMKTTLLAQLDPKA